MNINNQPKVNIVALEFYVPEKVLSNNELEKIFDSVDAEKIYKNTGIRNRHIAKKEVCVSDLSIIAAKNLFRNAEIDPKEIEMLIFCTQGPDYFLPATSCIIQDALGLSNSCAAFDMNLGCSGYVYGLAIAQSFIHSNMVNNVLLIIGDISSRTINPRDKSTRILFGDGVAATYISKKEGIAEISGDFILGTDGSGYQNIIIPAGAFRTPKTAATSIEKEDSEGNIRSLEDTYMNGIEVFTFALKRVPEVIDKLLIKTGNKLEQIDWFVFHQANKFILDYISRKMKIPSSKVLLSLEEYGNTSSASIPITFKLAQEKRLFKNGDLIMLIGFGVGYSWGANLLKWTEKT